MPTTRVEEMRSDGPRLDDGFHERQWRVQRIGWAVMAALLLAALAGLMGNGPLARAEAASSSLRLAYQRVERLGARTSIEWELMDSGSRRDLALWLNREYLEAFEITGIVPESSEDVVDERGTTFLFAGGPSAGRRHITFYLEPRHTGRVAGRAAAGGAAPVAFDQLVLP